MSSILGSHHLVQFDCQHLSQSLSNIVPCMGLVGFTASRFHLLSLTPLSKNGLGAIAINLVLQKRLIYMVDTKKVKVKSSIARSPEWKTLLFQEPQ